MSIRLSLLGRLIQLRPLPSNLNRLPRAAHQRLATAAYSSGGSTSTSSNKPHQADLPATRDMGDEDTAAATPGTDGAAGSQPRLPEALGLPQPPDGNTPQVEVGGKGVRFDHLGPVVVNVDGTVSRITNWDKMAEVEREATLRIIGRRNKARLEALRAQKEEAGGGGEQTGGSS